MVKSNSSNSCYSLVCICFLLGVSSELYMSAYKKATLIIKIVSAKGKLKGKLIYLIIFSVLNLYKNEMRDCYTYLENTLNLITLNVNLIMAGVIANYSK